MFQPALCCGRRNLGHGTHKLRNSRQHQVGFRTAKIGHQIRTKQPIMDGKLPNCLIKFPLICHFSQTVGKPEQPLILTKTRNLSQILLLLACYESGLESVGKASELRNPLFLAQHLDGSVVPGTSVARMRGVIVASIHRIRFRP